MANFIRLESKIDERSRTLFINTDQITSFYYDAPSNQTIVKMPYTFYEIEGDITERILAADSNRESKYLRAFEKQITRIVDLEQKIFRNMD